MRDSGQIALGRKHALDAALGQVKVHAPARQQVMPASLSSACVGNEIAGARHGRKYRHTDSSWPDAGHRAKALKSMGSPSHHRTTSTQEPSMSRPLQRPRDTRAWQIQVWISFGVAVLLCASGRLLPSQHRLKRNLSGDGLCVQPLHRVCARHAVRPTSTPACPKPRPGAWWSAAAFRRRHGPDRLGPVGAANPPRLSPQSCWWAGCS